MTMPGLDGIVVCSRGYSMLVLTQSAAGPAGGRTTNTQGNTRRPGLDATNSVLVAVREHDDVAVPRPVLLAVVGGDPTGATGNDVEQDDAVAVGLEDPRGLRAGQRFIRPGPAILRPEEHHSLQSSSLVGRWTVR